MMERLICLGIGYAFGLIQSGYLYGRGLISASTAAETQAPPMCFASWGRRQGQLYF